MLTDTSLQHLQSEFRRRLQNESSQALAHYREQNFTAFTRRGLPVTTDEDWKYTSLTDFKKYPFTATSLAAGVDENLLRENAIVVSNGQVVHIGAELKRTPGLKVTVTTEPGVTSKHFATGGFDLLNNAFFNNEIILEVSPGIQIPLPVYVTFATQPGAEKLAVFPRLRILLGAGAQATVFEHHLGAEGIYFSDSVTSIEQQTESTLLYTKLQKESPQSFHFASQVASLASGCRLTSTQAALGGLLSRQNTNVEVQGSQSEVHLNGLYLVRDKRLVDNHTQIHHIAPESVSRQLYKGVLTGEARAVFNGRIKIESAAQKTDSNQYNRNILLSDRAEVDTKPELLIDADDVKAAHGATVGQLSPDELFYLMARGLPRASALKMLSHGFVDEILFSVTDEEIRQELMQTIGLELDNFDLVGNRA